MDATQTIVEFAPLCNLGSYLPSPQESSRSPWPGASGWVLPMIFLESLQDGSASKDELLKYIALARSSEDALVGFGTLFGAVYLASTELASQDLTLRSFGFLCV